LTAESDNLQTREHVLALLKGHGYNATSFQVLEPGFRYWLGADDACVAFVDTGRAWVAAGAPIAPTERLGECAAAFVAAAHSAGKRAAFFGVEARFTDCAELDALGIGEQPVWDPHHWPATLRATRSLREQLRRARAKGVRVRLLETNEIDDAASAARVAVAALIERWLKSRSIAPMGFLVALHPFSFAPERRYFVAERDGSLFGFLVMAPVYARRGWFVEDFLRDPTAPNGTVELLIHHAMSYAARDGSRYLTLGLAPLAGDVSAWLSKIRDTTRPLYDFAGLRAFKEKLRPQHWDPIFVAYPRQQTELFTIFDTLAAFSRVGLFKFGLETLLRVPAIVVRGLATLLVPWTVMLALLSTRHWFPTEGVQIAWIAFDAILFFALWSLANRWRAWLGRTLAATVTLDALLTLAEVLWFNAPRTHGALDVAGMVIAVLAPSAAAALLWRACWHRAGLEVEP
jgi:phosphatidylglycerol lysyltransferase